MLCAGGMPTVELVMLVSGEDKLALEGSATGVSSISLQSKTKKHQFF